MKSMKIVAVAAAFLLYPALSAHAENEGQADLDTATQVKIAAISLVDLERVVELCESALEKGLDIDNESFAIQLITSTLLERASQLASPIFDSDPPDPRWQLLRRVALQNLEKAIRFDSQMGETHFLLARLHSLPGGDRQRGTRAANEAVRLAGPDKQQLSKALVVRGNLADDEDRRLADYNQSIIIDPKNQDALRVRGLFYLVRRDHENAILDFKKLLEGDAENVTAHHALAEAMTNLKQYDKALEHANKAIELEPRQALGYTLRARIHTFKDDAKAAVSDLDEALKIQPRDTTALLLRARLHQLQGNLDLAKQDVDRALIVQPGMPQAVLLRSMLSATEGRFDKAVTDIKSLLQLDPNNSALRLQLASYYVGDQRPRKAIKVFSALLVEDPENANALRGMADALLSIGKQAEAIADYEKILKLAPEHNGALNNLAWVLATSPDEELRDGQRSIELATQACELTDYKRPHILSTLAAGFAESGDFEAALKWSSKAVELGEESIKEQLSKELESYKRKKPWREIQQIEEKPDPGPRGGAFEL